MYHAINACRICGHQDFHDVVNLGRQSLTGVFPRSREEPVAVGPLELVKCDEATGGCGLVQLRHSHEPSEMYGDNYGYRSGLNRSMVSHLERRVREAREIAKPKPGDVILDIGSNDATTLKAYGNAGFRLVGIDPSAAKFRRYYPDWIRAVPDFFHAESYRSVCGDQQAKIVTSISMFYDLEDPLDFMRQIYSVLADDGIWVFEQSYLPLMVERDAYDTICHEHVSYYALRQIEWMTRQAGFEIRDVELNDINGGSFCVTVAKRGGQLAERSERTDQLLDRERVDGYGERVVYDRFRERIELHRDRLLDAIRSWQGEGKTLYGYGASTKGNVVLQYCGLTAADIPLIAEVNEDKYGCFTPGTLIPIASEAEVRSRKPDALLVLPWHFRSSILEREQAYLQDGGCMIFPLPVVDFVAAPHPTRRAA
ncbi:MAG: class I SAM-dependent methyltransferase [Pirellulales bacterium]|nr:class I SAM-dependent methyltransferase [Pirellulales bacterium]